MLFVFYFQGLQKNFELWDNDYTGKDDDFSGLVLYHELDGSFANGWRYTNGELTHKVRLGTDVDIDIDFKSLISILVNPRYSLTATYLTMVLSKSP